MTARIKNRDSSFSLKQTRKDAQQSAAETVSHDLHTPPLPFWGKFCDLKNDSVLTAKNYFAGEIHEDAEWLVGMVENLLTVTRVDGAVGSELNKVPEAAEEVVAEAVSKFSKTFPERASRLLCRTIADSAHGCDAHRQVIINRWKTWLFILRRIQEQAYRVTAGEKRTILR